jgi:hypothetical protein
LRESPTKRVAPAAHFGAAFGGARVLSAAQTLAANKKAKKKG